MDYASTFSSIESHSHACDNCGAEISLNISRQSGHNEKEEYYCPECNKRFTVSASLPIMPNDIQLLGRRTDGKTSRYQNPPLE
jgi:DNA-directed RNA polymerase subunit RPC12/RpoP